LTEFLQDESPQVRSDAVRAIYDEATAETFSEHPEILKQLAVLLAPHQPTPVNVRAIAANRRLGTNEAAQRIAAVLSSPQLDSTTQIESLYALQSWPETSLLDPVDGRHFPVAQGSPGALRNVIGPDVWALAGGEDDKISQLAIALLGRIEPTAGEKQQVLQTVLDENQRETIRVRWLDWLQTKDRDGFAATGTKLLSSDSPIVRATAAAKLRRASLANQAVENYLLQTLKEPRDPVELQRVIELVPTLSSKASIINDLLDQLVAGTISPEVQLEVLEVAAACADSDLAIETKLKEYQAKIDSGVAFGRYAAALYGGDPRAGSQLFRFNTQVQCSKCHALSAADKQIGPSLEGIGSRQNREYLLESIVDPTAKIVPGYGLVNILRNDGSTIQAVLVNESETEVTVRLPDSSTKIINRDDIEAQSKPTSAMPNPTMSLNLRQIRDLVAFLATL
jgi:putative heme-binding domain-containing protein